MRHGDKINNLGRKTAHRHALLMNLAIALIENKRIFTTLAKAKALRLYVEPLITKSKQDTTHSRRTAFSYLRSKEAVSTLFGDIATKVAERNGGYTRIIKTGNRQGDAAEMAMIELVDFNEIYTNGKKGSTTAKAKTTRRSRGAKKTAPAKGASADTSSVEEATEEN
ncbi:50S ribosomal protein L17 [Aurantibacillus circumpalustris]|uniref:50S ribosomal protein L17 n=1 Tax=Aurantibacillus circumpalustris TaxID=3036359 RepID=UPI00295BF587|nr:50S ribosomal protein L17 [Aurantibacillus circumpalustris]